jgi:D-alanine-D-alanine ligase
MGLRIGLVYDLRSEYLARGYDAHAVAEFDSDETITALEETIRSLGHAVERIGSARALCESLVTGRRWDLVFNIAEGLSGRCREAQAPAILELYDIPYTFSDPLVCAATLDKAVAKRIVRSGGLPTARFAVVEGELDLAKVRLPYPLFAKPIAEGTGKGIDGASRIGSRKELTDVCRRLLETFAQPVLVEEYLPGREFTTAVLGQGADARVLGSMEIAMRPKARTEIYSYEMKERCEELVDYSPMPRGRLRKQVEELALRSYRLLGCRDAARVDFRCDTQGRPVFLEVNPLPGLHPTHSDLPMIATQEGMGYAEFIGSIIDSACRRRGGRK